MLTLITAKLKKKLSLILLILLLISSNSIWFYRYDRTVKNLTSKLSQCESKVNILSIDNKECTENINKIQQSYINEIAYIKSTYNNKLNQCKQSKVKIKKIVEYKIKEVPVEKIKIVKELEKCNIQFIEVNNNEENPEDIVKYYLDHIGF